MADPVYRTDFDALANELRRSHGAAALDVAAGIARQQLQTAAWKSCAVWLQVANRIAQTEGRHP